MEFLGHRVGEEQMTVQETRAEALLNYNRPQMKKELLQTLHKTVSIRHSHSSPATSKVAPSKVNWTKDMELAFTNICRSVSQSCLLQYLSQKM